MKINWNLFFSLVINSLKYIIIYIIINKMFLILLMELLIIIMYFLWFTKSVINDSNLVDLMQCDNFETYQKIYSNSIYIQYFD